jgi:hypothetical protein
MAYAQCAKVECEKSTRGLEAVFVEGLGGQTVLQGLPLPL